MAERDVRWIQRLDNFDRALRQLSDAVELTAQRELSELERQGLIQSFEFCHELAWNVLKDYFAYQGNTSITGSRDAVREAFNKGLVDDGELWMEMIGSRNLSSHTYNKTIADQVATRIIEGYHTQFEKFSAQMRKLASKA